MVRATITHMDLIEALQFERDWENQSGSKVAEIRDRFGISAARYYQLLYAWLEQPETVQIDPELVHRLIRLRDHRARQRAARNFGQTAA